MLKKVDTLTDLDGKSVLMRIDTDVDVVHGHVVDDYRLKAALPSIRYLHQQGAKLTLIGQLSRPGGKVDPELRLKPVADRLAHLLVPRGQSHVHHNPKATSPIWQQTYQLAKDVVLLENIRFDPGEESNDPEFAKELAAGHNYFVNESFAVIHRDAASITGITELLPSYAGFRLVDELTHLDLLRHQPESPYVLIVGGAKMKEKLGLLETLIDRVDAVLTGGVVANMLLAADGVAIKDSKIEASLMDSAKSVLKKGRSKILLPTDYLWDGEMIADIGPETIDRYIQILHGAKTVFWAGCLGVTEEVTYAKGTEKIGRFLAHQTDAVRMIGGGDTATALAQWKLLHTFDFVSTGGGAALEYLAGHQLPGLEALEKGP